MNGISKSYFLYISSGQLKAFRDQENKICGNFLRQDSLKAGDDLNETLFEQSNYYFYQPEVLFGLQITPAPSCVLQLSELMWPHSSRLFSVPLQLTSSYEKSGGTGPKYDSSLNESAPWLNPNS